MNNGSSGINLPLCFTYKLCKFVAYSQSHIDMNFYTLINPCSRYPSIKIAQDTQSSLTVNTYCAASSYVRYVAAKHLHKMSTMEE